MGLVKMEDKNTQQAPAPAQSGAGVRAWRFMKRLFSDDKPETLKGLKGVWLLVSSLGAAFVVLALLFALFWDVIWACVLPPWQPQYCF